MDATVVFLAFTTAWCPPCQQMHRDFAGHQSVEFVDAEEHPEMVKQYGVRAFPTVVATRGGRQVGRRVGYSGKREMEQWMAEMQEQEKNLPDIFPYWDNEADGVYTADWEDGYPYDTGTVQE